ncbi:MAG: hypothetical protein OXT09_28510 [Myxococcales bacterium]|nr:hypothetical protein [Myxococcales bacterium]
MNEGRQSFRPAALDGGQPQHLPGRVRTPRPDVRVRRGDGTVAIERGLLRSSGGRLGSGVYCIGDGSTYYLREEMDFDDRITLALRDISRLPTCDGTAGDSELTACFRR